MDKVAGGIASVLLGVYLIRVAQAGNAKQLLKELAKEGHYLEFAIALYALWLLWKFGPTNSFTHQLMIAGGIALVFRAMGNNGAISQAMQDFGAGKITMLGAAKQIFGV